MIRGRLGLVATVAALAIALLLGRALSAVLVDQAWYSALGASAVWREKFLATLALKGGAWLLGSAFAFANLWAVRRTILAIAVPARVGDLEFAEVIPARRLLSVTVAAAAVVGMALTFSLNDWTLLSSAWHGTPFVEYEPFFQRDLGFYVYWLPFEGALYTWALISIVVVTALVTMLYAITRDLRLVGRQLVASTHVRRHLTALGALVLMLLAWSYRLDAYELLLWGSGFDGMFNRVDHVFTTRVDLGLAIGTFVAALIVLRAGWIGQVRAAFVTVTLVIVAALIFRQAGPDFVAAGESLGRAEVRDRDYQATRAIYTRRAYEVEGLRFGTTDSSDRTATDSASSDNVARLIAGTGIWDAEALSVPRATAEAPPAHVLPAVWQSGPNGAQAVVVTRSAAITPVWDVRVIPATFADGRGAPVWARHRQLGAGALAEPLIAPGFTEHRVVKGSAWLAIGGRRTVSAPGVPGDDPFLEQRVPAALMTGWGARLAHAWVTRDVSLLTSSGDDNEPVAVVMHRDVRERVQRILPMLVQGSHIAPVVYNEKLLWALDLYAASDFYPLSVRFHAAGAARSYFRLAATALIDAQTGRVRIVPVDDPDPIARTWFARIPSLLLADTLLPPALRAQRPIADDGAMAQLRAFTRVGSRRTGHLPRFMPDSVPGATPYPVSALDRNVISWSVPLVDDLDQLVGVFEASGGAARGSAWHPLADPLPRWSALRDRLSGPLDSVASLARSDADGPITLGAVRVRYDQGQLVLVRPAYASDASGPHLIAVAASTDSGVLVGSSLTALTGGAGGTARPGEGFPARTLAEQQAEARRLYDSMRDALRQSDWVRFGATFDSLGRVLDRRP